MKSRNFSNTFEKAFAQILILLKEITLFFFLIDRNFRKLLYS